MLRTRLHNFFKLNKSTKKQFKAGAIAILAACFLHYSASFQLTLSVVTFILFSLYLYFDRLQDKIFDLESALRESQFKSFEREKVKSGELEIEEKPRKEAEKASSLQTTPRLGEFDENLILKVEKGNERLIQAENSITNLQNSFEVFAQRIDRLEKSLKPILEPKITKERPSRPLRENNSGQDIQRKVSELFRKYQQLPEIEQKLNQLQETVKSLEDLQLHQTDLESIHSKVQASDQRITKFAETLSQLSQNAAIEDLSQRLLNIEAKGLLLEDILRLVENTNQRLSRDEDNMQVLSDTIVGMGDSVNLRVDALSQIMKDYFTEITKAISRNQRA